MFNMGLEAIKRAKATFSHEEPLKLLDFGCSNGKLTEQIATIFNEGSHKAKIHGYDLSTSKIPKLDDPVRNIHYSSCLDDLEPQSYDIIVVSRVLCCVNDETFNRCLLDITRLLKPHGKVILSVCNPFFVCHGSTPHQIRMLPEGANEEERFTYKKQVASTKSHRQEWYKPFHYLKREFLKVGLQVKEMHMTDTVDIDTFEPNSDYSVIELQSFGLKSRVECSLLIKCSSCN